MNQLIFKFPFSTNYFEEDYYVSSNNFEAYKLIETWPKWPSKFINIYGPTGCGKTHLANIFNKKLNSHLICASKVSDNFLPLIKLKECLIIDDYKSNINEKLFYSILNEINQSNKYIIVNSSKDLKTIDVSLTDLQSRLKSFVNILIDLPTDDLIRVVLVKNFSDKQIKFNNKLLEFVLKNINRSYEDIARFIDKIDELSLSAGKSININLIKKALNE